MSSSFKNIIVLLLVLTFALTGYYLYSKNKDGAGTEGANQYVTTEMVKNTQLFIERSETLKKINIDLSVFDDPLFISYRNFTKPIVKQEQGRENPFDEFEPSLSNTF